MYSLNELIYLEFYFYLVPYLGVDLGPVGCFLYQPYNIYDEINHKTNIITNTITNEDFILPKFVLKLFIIKVY